MVICKNCGKKFKTNQALSGHKRFKHDSDFIKAKISGKVNHERILINGRTVVKISDLGLSIDTLSRIKALALRKGCNDDEFINDLINKSELIEAVEGFRPIRCGLCYKVSWAPEDVFTGKRIFMCTWCWRSSIQIVFA